MKAKAVGKNRGMIVWMLIFAALFSLCLYSNDLPFLLNSGRYIAENKTIPSTEPFTIHEGLAFQMQQWLTCVIFWGIFKMGGYYALIGLVMVFFTLQIYVLYRICLLVSDQNRELAITAAFVAIVLTGVNKITRPYIFTFLIFYLEIYCMEQYCRTRKARWLGPLPVLSLLEINLHAAMWPMMLVLMLPYLAEQIVCRRKIELPTAGITLAMTAIGFLNPYGWDGMLYTYHAYSSELSKLVWEMRPPAPGDPVWFFICGSIFITAVLIIRHRENRTRIRYALLLLGTLYMALSAMRHWQFFVMASVIFLSNFYSKSKLPALHGLNIAVLLCLAGVSFWSGVKEKFGLSLYEEGRMGAEQCVAEYCDPQNTRIYCHPDLGGDFQYCGFRTFMDARSEVFLKGLNKKEDFFEEYLNLQTGKMYYKDFLDKYALNCIVIDSNDLMKTFLPYDDDWEIMYRDNNYSVYLKRER